MRGDDLQQAGMFSYLSPEQRVPQDHPLRAIRKLCDAVFCGTVAPVRQTLRPHGAPFDRTGEVAERFRVRLSASIGYLELSTLSAQKLSITTSQAWTLTGH